MKVMIIGGVGAGKTTLIQRMSGLDIKYDKTQSLEFINGFIDTPGEYLENRLYHKAIVVTACDADLLIFVEDATNYTTVYSTNYRYLFNIPVIGIITKTDKATTSQVNNARSRLVSAGVSDIYLGGLDEDLQCIVSKF